MKTKMSLAVCAAALLSISSFANDTASNYNSTTPATTETDMHVVNHDLPVAKGGLTRDHAFVQEHCGVGNYLFRGVDCPKTVTEVIQPTQAVAERAPIDREKEIFFDTDSSTIGTEHLSELSPTIEFLQGHPNAKVEISGFADATGTENYNEKLANRRARALRDHLLQSNVSASQVAIVTPAKPVSDTPNNRPDRRVELHLHPMLAE